MANMTVEEAVKQIEDVLQSCRGSDGVLLFTPIPDIAIRIVLDELKALQECESCRCDGGNKCLT